MNGLALRTLNGLALCAGAGGLELGVHIADPDYRTVAYVEREASAAASLVARMEDEALDKAPVADDIKAFDGRPWRGVVDIITAGYPCQPFSTAGKRLGEDDPRHLWPDIRRIINEVQPSIIFLENVPGHLNLGLYEVCGDLQAMDYTVTVGLFSAEETGASHERLRLFIMVHRIRSGSNSRPERAGREERPDTRRCGEGPDLENAECHTNRTERDDCKVDRTDPARPASRTGGSSQELAHSECIPECPDGGQLNARTDGRRHTGRSGSGLGSGGNMADTQGDERGCEQQPREQAEHGRSGLTGASEGLADTIDKRGQISSSGEFSTIKRTRGHGDELPLFAPGPNDFEAWARILEIDPGLKPSLCRDADGMAGRLDRLRLCGNGVSPLAAAYAYRTLSDALREHAGR